MCLKMCHLSVYVGSNCYLNYLLKMTINLNTNIFDEFIAFVKKGEGGHS